jgi:hypothetical protein
LSRKKLNQTKPAQSPIARMNTRETTMRRFIGGFPIFQGPATGHSS